MNNLGLIYQEYRVSHHTNNGKTSLTSFVTSSILGKCIVELAEDDMTVV